MTSLDRRTMLTALLGGCVAAATLGTAATSALAVPSMPTPKPNDGTDTAAAAPEALDTVAGQVHHAQYIVVRRRPRRRWRLFRRARRRRVFFY